MKKTLCILMTCLLVVLCLVACGDPAPTTQGNNRPTAAPTAKPTTTATTTTTATPTQPTEPLPTTPPHVCEAEERWHADLAVHWQSCECGEIMNIATHVLEMDCCAVCGADITYDDFDNVTYLMQYDAYDHCIHSACYDADNKLLYVYDYEYTYENDRIVAEKHYEDGIPTYSCTYDEYDFPLTETLYDYSGNVIEAYVYERTYDEEGNLLSCTCFLNEKLDSKVTYHPVFGVLCPTEEIRYYPDGGTFVRQMTYDEDGLISLELVYEYDALIYKYVYAVSNFFGDPWPYVCEEYCYEADGSYTLYQYDSYGDVISSEYLDANGNPVDHSGKFDSAACAPLFGTWTGIQCLGGNALGFELEGISLNADFTITFHKDGTFTGLYTMDPEEMCRVAEKALLLTIYEIYEGKTHEELNAIFQAEHGMDLAAYIQQALDLMDLENASRVELEGVYYVQGDMLYMGSSWNYYMSGAPFAVENDQLTMSYEDMELMLTKQTVAERPVTPPEDFMAHSKFDASICAPLFGAWEYSQVQTTAGMGYDLAEDISVTMTIRITFTENGLQAMQMYVDEDAYYNYMLTVTMENTYSKYAVKQGMTREEVDAEYASRGTSVLEEATNTLSNRKLLPDDGYFCFYVEDGVLYYLRNLNDTPTQIRITINGNTMIFHDPSGEEDIILTKVK